ncbi:hypothetical protein [Cerasicoccus arenae]|uniref:Uncharacterized protein n=1 Tax=Cerasicoccus arenae TaxID=424488 RepID=A0A8J3DH14_9BACT|nr:hypothetical protein [Cerasicoccus arenae]MBK1859146.1 hypothetical protein [Cerasicoccus arenae]GHB98123.1 hypothetical protein GCM10007047_12630 [Cerasicoccus arenae]
MSGWLVDADGMNHFLRFFSLSALMLASLSAQALDSIDKQVVVDFLNARRTAYLSGDPAVIIQAAAPDITVTMISSVVEGPAGTRSMRLPQYVPFLKEAFANTEYYGYDFKGVKAQMADDGQSAKVFVDVEEDARIQGLPVKASKALIFTLVINNGVLQVTSLTEQIGKVDAGIQISKKAPTAGESTSGSGQSAVKIGK